MKALSFFSRFALICNILFVICLTIQRTYDFLGSKDVSAVVITLGWFISPVINLVVSLWYGIRFISKKPLIVPVWLVAINFLFLLMQLFIHFILPS
jgi:hypothetical protein